MGYYKKKNKLDHLINAQDKNGRTPLMLALVTRNQKAVILLVENGAKVLWPPRGPNLVYLAHVVPEFHDRRILDEESAAECIYKQAAYESYINIISIININLPGVAIPRELIFQVACAVAEFMKLRPY